MTQEKKNILLKDLYARYYYNPIVCAIGWEEPIRLSTLDMNKLLISALDPPKPYLRPPTSMTEEEKEEYFDVCDEDIKTLSVAMDAPDIIISDRGRTQGYVACKELEWFYEHHFDFTRKIGDEYKTLTDLGLAIEAPEGMYHTKK